MTEAEARSWAILITAVFTGIVAVITAWQNKQIAAQNEKTLRKVEEHEERATTRARLRGEEVNPREEKG